MQSVRNNYRLVAQQIANLVNCPLTALMLCSILTMGGYSAKMQAADSGGDTADTGQQASTTAYEASDSMFSEPYTDVDEWRDQPVGHRYVHGGFKNTDTRFSFYFPPAEQYQGRFFQYITPVPDNENLSQGQRGEEDKISFAIDSGAYFVETNGGGREGMSMPGAPSDPTIGAYRANAAVARYSRVVAAKLYDGERPYGYAFGGSGGGFRTLAGMENTEGAWDGAVPFVIGSPMAIPNGFTIRTYAMRVLEQKLPAVADAVDVGSNRNPFTDIGLNDEERGALREATRMGFPLRGWHAWDYLGLHAFALLFPAVVASDPAYFDDFWSKPGYEGSEPPESLKRALIDHTTTIEKLIDVEDAIAMGLQVGHLAGQPRGLADDAWKALQGEQGASLPVAIKVKSAPQKNTLGADLRVVSGAAAGKSLPMARLDGDIVLFTPGAEEAVAAIKAGDEVRFDNRNFLAVQTYHRHQVPGPEQVPGPGFPVYDQFRDERGKPIYPQRPLLLGPRFSQGATGTRQTGKFKGKMIVVENLYDTEAYAWQADWYRKIARETFGDELDNHLRVWMIDHADHSDSTLNRDPTHLVSYIGVLQQALRDVAAWVEQDIEPPATTNYKVVDGQIEVPATATARRGIQPVVKLTANGGKRAEVKAGDTVDLLGVVEVPPGTGEVVVVQWDLDGSGKFATAAEFMRAGENRVEVKLQHRFDQPGTYFPTLKVASQRAGDADTPFTRIRNLDRARVVVAN